MTQLSKIKVSERVLERLYKLFFQTVGNQYSFEDFQKISDDLFSRTEQLMIAKRIAIFYLLIKEIDQYTISKTLKVSSSTIAKFSFIKSRSYGIVPFLNKVVRNEKIKHFFEDLYFEVLNTHWGVKFRHRWQRKIEKASGI